MCDPAGASGGSWVLGGRVSSSPPPRPGPDLPGLSEDINVAFEGEIKGGEKRKKGAWKPNVCLTSLGLLREE